MSFLSTLGNAASTLVIRILEALVIYFVGKWIIQKLTGLFDHGKLGEKMDPTVRSFVSSLVKYACWVLLVIMIVGVLGVPMASVITVLAAGSAAIGLALQGSLSNFAGGIMLIIMRPFKVGDYISAAGAEGTVESINTFYTRLKTVDNKVITIPNGSLMNSNIVDYSAKDFRRVDLNFSLSKDADLTAVTSKMQEVLQSDERILSTPEKPFARLTGATDTAAVYTVRAWVKNADYWDVYYSLTEKITTAMNELGVKAPAARIITSEAE